MKIIPVRFTENGFMTRPFALGGEGAEGLDPAVKYRSCLQNWVVDTGSEVILVDTGLPAEFPDMAADPEAGIFVGSKIKTYLEALADLGYKPEQVSKILITHKHADHTGELRAFPNAQIICSAAEAEADEIKPFHPTVAAFADGPFFEFPASQRIAPGVTYLPAPGHTKGNSIVAVETDGLFWLIHGDVTYTDVALYENKLSVVFEDQAAARETLDRCRAFCRARPTVWLGTHTPEALESLEAKRVVDLDNPPAVIPPGEIVFKTPTGKYVCSVCGYVYDPAEHDGVAFEALPADWRCPRCKRPKSAFNRA
ncbi:MAG: MBL fold metallo-hydrolase [Kiritimatiellae bacterium]|nr:MBL fold metallo-hydrolase [Kiritimatiellia bacterium]